MAAKQPSKNGQTNEGMMSDNILTGSEGAADFIFEYDSNLEEAVQPQPLPEGRFYRGVVDSVKHAVSQLNGEPQMVMRIVIPPEEYPIDFPQDHHPDGVSLVFYGPSMGNNVQGRFNAKRIATAFKVPLGNSLRGSDFQNKRVKVAVQHRTRDDGSISLIVKGMPEAID